MENTEGSVIEYTLLDLLQKAAITFTIALSSENMTTYIHNLNNWFMLKKEQDITNSHRNQPQWWIELFDCENVLTISFSSENAVDWTSCKKDENCGIWRFEMERSSKRDSEVEITRIISTTTICFFMCGRSSILQLSKQFKPIYLPKLGKCNW